MSEEENEINTCPNTMEEFMKQLDKLTKRAQGDVEAVTSGFERLVRMAVGRTAEALKYAYGRYLTSISTDVVMLEGTVNTVSYVASASRLLKTALTPLLSSADRLIAELDRALCRVTGISLSGERCEVSAETITERLAGAMTLDTAKQVYRMLAPALIYATSLSERASMAASELVSTEATVNTITTDCLPADQRKLAEDTLRGTRERIGEELTAMLLLVPSIKEIARSLFDMTIKTGAVNQDMAKRLAELLTE